MIAGRLVRARLRAAALPLLGLLGVLALCAAVLGAAVTARTVTLPALGGRLHRVPLGAYVAAVKRAKAAPDVEFKHGLTTWWPTTGAEIVEQFRRGMVDRINAAIPYAQRGDAQEQISERTPHAR